MALTTGINYIYSSLYRALPQKAVPLGTPSTVYEYIGPTPANAALPIVMYFSATIPVGFGWASTTNFDVLKICDIGGNFGQGSPANTVVSGLRLREASLRCSGNVGNTMVSTLGYALSNNIAPISTSGTGSLLQGGAVVGVPIATASAFLQSANTAQSDPIPTGSNFVNSLTISPIVVQNDALVLVPTNAVNATTTQQTVDGWVEFWITAPTGF